MAFKADLDSRLEAIAETKIEERARGGEGFSEKLGEAAK